MKSVRCNKCNTEYVICDELNKLGFPLGKEECLNCGATDYVVLEGDIQFEYSTYVKSDDMATENEDMRHSAAFLKDELNELIKTYLDPFIK